MAKQPYTVYETGREPYVIEYDAEERRKTQRDDRQDFATERAQRFRHLIELKQNEVTVCREGQEKLAAHGDPSWRAMEMAGDLIEAEIRGLQSGLQILVGTRA